MPPKSRIYWPAAAILGLEWEHDDLTCLGTTKQAKRCQNPINVANRSKIRALLTEASAKDVIKHGIDADLQEVLDELSSITLCVRFHQKPGRNCQVPENLKQFEDAIVEFRKSEKAIRVPPASAPVATQKPARDVAVKVEKEEPSSHRTVHEDFLTPPLSPGREISNPSRYEKRTLSIKPRPPPRHRPITPVDDGSSSTSSSCPSSSEDEQSLSDSPSPSSSPPPPPSRRRIRRPQVLRQTDTPTCSFCGDPVSDLEDAVWCQRECGRNMHCECFEDHIEAKEKEDVECAFCHAPWFFDSLSRYYFDKNQ